MKHFNILLNFRAISDGACHLAGDAVVLRHDHLQQSVPQVRRHHLLPSGALADHRLQRGVCLFDLGRAHLTQLHDFLCRRRVWLRHRRGRRDQL